MNASLGASIVLATVTSVAIADDPAILAGVVLQAATPDPTTTIQLVLPIDVVELTKAVLTGIAAIGSAFAAVYSVVGAARAKRAEFASKLNSTDLGKVQANVALIERNTNSLTTRLEAAALKEGTSLGIIRGLQTGADTADTLDRGRREGRDDERASVAASNPSIIPGPVVASHVGAGLAVSKEVAPVPVADDRTAEASERVADASERSAEATERVAAATEEKSKGSV